MFYGELDYWVKHAFEVVEDAGCGGQITIDPKKLPVDLVSGSDETIRRIKHEISGLSIFKTLHRWHYMGMLSVFFSVPLQRSPHLLPARTNGVVVEKQPFDFRNSLSYYRKVVPKFEAYKDEVMQDIFTMLSGFFEDLVTHCEGKPLEKFLEASLLVDLRGVTMTKSDISVTIWSLFDACVRLFKVMGLSACQTQGLCPNKITGRPTLVCDYVFECEDVPLMLLKIDTKVNSFVELGRLNQEDEYFRDVLRQCNGYMHSWNLPYILITNLETTILLELDLDAKIAENASDEQFVCRYGYTIIRLCDVRFSLQAVIMAFLVLSFGKSVRKRDIKVKQAWLKQWLRNEADFFKSVSKYTKTQMELAECLVMSPPGRDRALEQFLAAASERVKKNLRNETTVDFSRFDSIWHIDWVPQNDLQIVGEGSEGWYYQYSFIFTDNIDTSKLISVPPLGTKLFLKAYRVETDDCSDSSWVKHFTREVLAFTRIVKHNQSHPKKKRIAVPEFYGYGPMALSEASGGKSAWFYLLTSYVEDEESIMTKREVNTAKRRLIKDLEKLKSVGIDNVPFVPPEKRLNRTTPVFIGYGDVPIAREPN